MVRDGGRRQCPQVQVDEVQRRSTRQLHRDQQQRPVEAEADWPLGLRLGGGEAVLGRCHQLLPHLAPLADRPAAEHDEVVRLRHPGLARVPARAHRRGALEARIVGALEQPVERQQPPRPLPFPLAVALLQAEDVGVEPAELRPQHGKALREAPRVEVLEVEARDPEPHVALSSTARPARMPETLIVTNGDIAAARLAEAAPDTSILPWRDMLHDGPVPADLPLRILSGLRARWLAQEVDLERAAVETTLLARDLRLTLVEPGSEVIPCLVPPEFPWLAPTIARLLEELPGPDGPSARRCARSRPAGRGRHPVQARRRAGGGRVARRPRLLA